MNSSRPDILVIGGGIAGASAAAEIARTQRVVLLEREASPGYHSTGRSAALFSESYGNAPVRALSRASRQFFFDPPHGFSAYPLVKRRGWLHIARAEQATALESFLAQQDLRPMLRRVGTEEALALSPLLRPEAAAAGGAYEEGSADIDVHALHQGYLRLLRQRGGTILTGAAVTGLGRTVGEWSVTSTAGDFRAPVIVNAAGAWADAIAALAGVPPLTITACRRTAALIELPDRTSPDEWPLTICIEETYYFKPDAGLLLISPADETPVAPCDAQPEVLDVAIAVDRVENATTLTINRIRRQWAGLRCFAPDRAPVIGFDPAASGFFWLAGQGGYGIQTAPAVSQLAASLVHGETSPQTLVAAGLELASVSPARFRGGSESMV